MVTGKRRSQWYYGIIFLYSYKYRGHDHVPKTLGTMFWNRKNSFDELRAILTGVVKNEVLNVIL